MNMIDEAGALRSAERRKKARKRTRTPYRKAWAAARAGW